VVLTLSGSSLLLAQSADIVIGQSAPRTGGNADFGKDIRAGAR